MLLTDSDIISQADIAALDPQVTVLVDTASADIPAISGSTGIIRNVAEEACQQIQANFQTYSGYLLAPGADTAGLAAVLNVYSTAVSRGRMRVDQVVALEPDMTKGLVANWMKYSALFQFFRAMSHAKQNDRFDKKRDYYQAEARRRWERIERTGMPVSLTPLAAPGAVRTYQAGTWGNANLSASGTGSTDPGGTWTVQITYTGSNYGSWSKTNNAESAPSASATVTTTSGQYITVSIASLNPPAGLNPNIGTADTIYAPMAATGWNVYVCGPSGTPMLQNSAPIPIGTTTYTLSNEPTTNASYVGPGQAPDYYFAFNRVFQRA